MVTVKIPAPPKGLFSNLLGLAGLIALVFAVGGLTHNWWWALLAAGVVAVGLSWIAQLNATVAEDAREEQETQVLPRLAARSA